MYHKPDDANKRSLRSEVQASERATGFAKELRRELSPPERLLWSRLKGAKLGGFKFRLQHPLGPWIADFYCHAAMLVVEIDGPTHRAERLKLDDVHDRWMTERNLGVLRFSGKEVFANLRGVLSTILHRAQERVAEIASPGSTGGGGRVLEAGGGAPCSSQDVDRHSPSGVAKPPPPPPLGAGEAIA